MGNGSMKNLAIYLEPRQVAFLKVVRIAMRVYKNLYIPKFLLFSILLDRSLYSLY